MRSLILILSRNDSTAGPMAASYLVKKLAEAGDKIHEVRSVGLQVRRSDSVGAGARKVLEDRQITLQKVGATQVTLKDVHTADLILCLSEEIRSELSSRFHFDGPKAIRLMSLVASEKDIFEPRSSALEANAQCLDMMMPALDLLATRVADAE